MKNIVKEKVLTLYQDDGMTAKEISKEMLDEVSISTIHRWINEFKAEQDFLSGVVDDDESSIDLGNIDSDEDEEYSENDLGELIEDNQEEELTDETELEGDSPILGELEIRKNKRGIEKKIKKLFNAIFSHSSGHEWTNSQLKRMLRSLDSIQDQIENIFDYDSESFRANAYWVYLESFIDLFQSFVNAGGDVEIDFDQNLQDEINTVLSIEEFDVEYVWEDIFEAGFLRLKNDLNEIDGQKLDSDAAYEYERRISDLVTELEENDSELAYTNEMSILKGLKKDFKRLFVTIDESFWGSAMFELDEEFQS